MDSKEIIKKLKEIKLELSTVLKFAGEDLNKGIRHKYLKRIIALDKATAYIEIWDKFYKDIEQLRDEQAENLKGFNGTYRDGYRDALDVILLSMETRKEGIEKCKEKNVKGL